jgi:hypothetical protein
MAQKCNAVVYVVLDNKIASAHAAPDYMLV